MCIVHASFPTRHATKSPRDHEAYLNLELLKHESLWNRCMLLHPHVLLLQKRHVCINRRNTLLNKWCNTQSKIAKPKNCSEGYSIDHNTTMATSTCLSIANIVNTPSEAEQLLSREREVVFTSNREIRNFY